MRKIKCNVYMFEVIKLKYVIKLVCRIVMRYFNFCCMYNFMMKWLIDKVEEDLVEVKWIIEL